MNRISVIGTSGSGKTTFASKLAGILRIPMAHATGVRRRLKYGKRD
jgi:adenylate kinase family enzyme